MLKAAQQKRSMAECIIADAISGLVGSESLKDRKSMTGAILALRQLVIVLERRGFASKNDTERCFELISILDKGY